MMPDNTLPSTVAFHYVKGNYFRVVHTNGIFGGLNPDGTLLLCAFSERAPLPDVTVSKVESDGKIGPEIVEQRKSSLGIVRELEVGLNMDLKTARIVVEWLKERIALAEKLIGDTEPAPKEDTAEVKQ